MIFVRPRNSWLWIGTSFVAVLLIIAIAPPPHLSGTPGAPSPIPFLQAISPVSALPGGTAFVLTVTGTNFAANSIVEWGTTQLATTFVSPVKLTAVVPAPVIATRGAGWITVVTPAPGGGTSNTLFLPVTVTVSTLTFGESTTPGTDSDWSVVEGDFNNDGNLDVVSANRASNSLTVFLGNGNGTFQAGQTIALSTSPFGLVAGDLNHDGNLDLIFSPINATSGGIAVLLGNGDGSFQAPSIIAPFGSDVDSCLTLALADLDGDGNLDLVAGITRREGIQVFLGNGDGTFQAPDNYGLELGPIDQVKIGDLNGDGKLDLITTNESEISILLGNGDGTFQSSLSYPLQTVVSIGVADFDGDGNPDVAAATTNNGLFLLRGNGDGSLQSPQFIGAGVDFGIETGDFDGDGKLDIVTTDGQNNTLDFYLGNGDGTFQSVQSFGSDLFRLWVFPVGNFASDQGLAVVAADSANSLLLFQTALVVSPTIVDFGRVTVGATPGSQSVTLTNGTQANVSIVAVSIAQAGADFQLGSNACIGMLAANASCMIQINFSPSQVGSESATLEVNGSAPNGPQSALLRGVGQLTQPTATLSSNFATFPSDVSGATSPPQLVTLTNTGSVSLPITTISLGGQNPGDFTESNDCGTTLAPNATCTLTMTFSPTAGGLRMATVLLTDGAPDSPQNIRLQGVGQDFTVDVTTPVITVAPGSTAQFHVNIGPQGSFSRLITFTCSGAPRNSTCSVAPSSITPTAASTDVVVSFITQAQFLFFTASPAAKPIKSRFLYPIFSVALAFVWYRKGHGRTLKRLAERQLTTARALAVFAGLVILFGCGQTNVPTVRTGAYNLTITATSGSLSHSSALTVIVQ